MNQYPPESQGAREQLSAGPSGPLDVAAVDRKKIFRSKFSYGVFLVHLPMGRLMQWVLDGRRVWGWSGRATDVEGFGECDGEIGAGLSVGRGEGLTSG